jgi:hypothetical protein
MMDGRVRLVRHLYQCCLVIFNLRGHMETIYNIYGYLKHFNRSTLVFDDAMIDWKDTDFNHYDWTDVYHEAKENIPPNAPVPRGNPVQINAFVDANHARNKVTRRSHTGILIYLNTAPILWYSKAQTTVETSTFGSEFVAMCIAVDVIEGLHYKLHMFGVPVDGPENVLSDNMTVLQLSRRSTLPFTTTGLERLLLQASYVLPRLTQRRILQIYLQNLCQQLYCII